ncbi:MAG: TetR/AcrR family transcriptional regulator [bacterium]
MAAGRRRDGKEERVNAILAAAADLFASRSYDGITMEEIARGAGFTRPRRLPSSSTAGAGHSCGRRGCSVSFPSCRCPSSAT